jgi:hypothetical protein
MARITADEMIRRREVEGVFNAIRHNDKIRPVEEVEEIRVAALAMFTKRLDAKLKNLQQGEYLSVIFEIDILTGAGKVRGGSGSERTMPEYIQWRKSVFERDGFKCRDCGETKHLQAHHIKPWTGYPELRFDIDNGLTLCRDCHAKRHPHINFNQ